MSTLVSTVVPVPALSQPIRDRMFELLAANYDCVSHERFRDDLSWKDEVISLRDLSGEIQGFTTLAFNPKNLSHPAGDILFSGDTIIDPAHWGSTELVYAFCRRAAEWRSEHGRRLFWMLISKGHRTYLFLPLFAKRFFPHPERCELQLELLASAAAAELFGDAWNPHTGVLQFGESLGQLKPQLAQTSWQRRRSPMVKFFLEKNPGFASGDELVCMTELAEENLKRAALLGFQQGLPAHA